MLVPSSAPLAGAPPKANLEKGKKRDRETRSRLSQSLSTITCADTAKNRRGAPAYLPEATKNLHTLAPGAAGAGG